MDYLRRMEAPQTPFHIVLMSWYLNHKRELPWRSTPDPYKVWLSEIILQQTRIVQGLPYYQKFVSTYPTVHHLARATEAEVLKNWQGLGYYSRARNLHATAKIVSAEMNGVFPENYRGLLKLKGVGDYTASAIASICYRHPHAVVDGNVYRVLSRIFGIDTPINTSSGQKQFKQLAQQLIDPEDPGTYNQAIMDFGATHCTPQNPDCTNCIFASRCTALKEGTVTELPVKQKAKPIKKRFFNYLVILSEDEKTMLQQRQEKGIWQKLYEFPLIETQNIPSLESLRNTPQFESLTQGLPIQSITRYQEAPVIHKLSHQHIYAHFWIVETLKTDNNTIPISEIHSYAVPVLIENFVSDFFEKY